MLIITKKDINPVKYHIDEKVRVGTVNKIWHQVYDQGWGHNVWDKIMVPVSVLISMAILSPIYGYNSKKRY